MRTIKLFYSLAITVLLLLILGDFKGTRKRLLSIYLNIKSFAVKNRKKGT